MLPSVFKPYKVSLNSLKRIGPKHDGGYVVHKNTIKLTEIILTFGLSDDWEFEKDFIKNKPKTKIIAYDHTVTTEFWIKRFLKDLLHFFLLKKLRIKKILDIFKYLDYLLFFTNHIHFKKKIGNLKKEINLNKIFKKKFKNGSVLLKVDIEGDEYKILDQIQKYSSYINTLTIEFHNIHKKNNIKKLEYFIKKSKFKLIHIHANNYSFKTKSGIPPYLELTFINIEFIKCSSQTSSFKYPIKYLDYPNRKRFDDIKLQFKKSKTF